MSYGSYGGGYYGGGYYGGDGGDGGSYGSYESVSGYGGYQAYGGYYGGYQVATSYAEDFSPTSASASGKTVTFTNPDGSTFTQTGDHPDRDNNPLDMRGGSFTNANGAIGNDAGFAIFANSDQGFAAAQTRMGEIGGTLDHIISVWSPPSENDTASMQSSIPSAAGLSGSDNWSSLSSSQQQSFLQAYAQHEGYHR